MDRLNPEGIRRDQLGVALANPRVVLSARRIDACLLCRRPRVNDAGLCEVCYSSLDGDDLRAATRWLAGVGP